MGLHIEERLRVHAAQKVGVLVAKRRRYRLRAGLFAVMSSLSIVAVVLDIGLDNGWFAVLGNASIAVTSSCWLVHYLNLLAMDVAALYHFQRVVADDPEAKHHYLIADAVLETLET